MKPKRLSLERETLVPLSPSDLDKVNGGDLFNTIGLVTRYVCRPTVELATRAFNCNDPAPQAK